MTPGALVETEPAWGQDDPIVQPSRPAFWLFVGLVGMGAVLILHRVGPAIRLNPSATSLTVVLWTLYSVPFFLLVRRLDLLEPEPPLFLAAAFAWGSIVSVSIAIVANESMRSIMTKVGGVEFTQRWFPSLSAPSTEETLKALGLVVVILIARRQVTSILDGLVYGFVVGLGFQVTENLIHTTDTIGSSVMSVRATRTALDVFVLRGFALGMWSHAVYSALTGVGIAYAVLSPTVSKVRRAVVASLAFAFAWLLHFLWNAPFFQPSAASRLAVKDLAIYIGKGLPALAIVIVVFVMARRREVAWFDDALRQEPSCASEDEVIALSTFHGRRHAVSMAVRDGGQAAGANLRRLQRAQVRLAVARARGKSVSEHDLETLRGEVRAARVHLATTASS
jgi:RsiW-degrading membrane proteinase PrsW (M82 family)